jgi:hypothetical protein
MAPLRVSILGTGLSLQAFHYPLIVALPDQFVLHSVLERSNAGKAKAVCGAQTKVVTTIEEVVNDKDVDVVSLQRIDPAELVLTRLGRHFHAQQHALPLRQGCPRGRQAR